MRFLETSKSIPQQLENPYFTCTHYVSKFLKQRWSNSVLQGYCPAEFSSKPNKTHPNKLINVFRVTRKLQAGEFLLGIEQNSEEQRPSMKLPITILKG